MTKSMKDFMHDLSKNLSQIQDDVVSSGMRVNFQFVPDMPIGNASLVPAMDDKTHQPERFVVCFGTGLTQEQLAEHGLGVTQEDVAKFPVTRQDELLTYIVVAHELGHAMTFQGIATEDVKQLCTPREWQAAQASLASSGANPLLYTGDFHYQYRPCEVMADLLGAGLITQYFRSGKLLVLGNDESELVHIFKDQFERYRDVSHEDLNSLSDILGFEHDLLVASMGIPRRYEVSFLLEGKEINQDLIATVVRVDGNEVIKEKLEVVQTQEELDKKAVAITKAIADVVEGVYIPKSANDSFESLFGVEALPVIGFDDADTESFSEEQFAELRQEMIWDSLSAPSPFVSDEEPDFI